MCCTRLENTGCKNYAKNAVCAPSHTFVGLYLHNEGTYRQSEKELLNSNTSSTCSHNVVNFGLLAAEFGLLVWDTQANFISTGFASGRRYCTDVAKRTSTNLYTMFWPSPELSTLPGAVAFKRNFGRCEIHFASKSRVLLYRQRYCTALE